MSIEEVTDLMDLFEYDEFDSYEEHTYQLSEACKTSTESGIPLSVELSESFNKNQSSDSEQSSSGFVKAPEIFLRIESITTGGVSTTEENTENINQNNECQNNVSKKLKYCSKSNSLDSTESNEALLIPNRDDCVELQYENEFIDSNDEPNCDFNQKSNRQDNNIENDYEELLMEGTKIS